MKTTKISISDFSFSPSGYGHYKVTYTSPVTGKTWSKTTSNMPELAIKYKSSGIKKVQIKSSDDAFQVLRDMYDADTLEYNESTILIFLNQANNTIGWTRHTSGGMAATIVDIKMIMAEALLCGASSIMFSHNHPSGQLSPSPEDVKLTGRIKEACATLDIRFLDHIIVAGDLSGYFSFADEGRI